MLPIKPGDIVYFVLFDDKNTIESDTVNIVGVNDDGRLLVTCDFEYEVGLYDQCFMSREDAHLFLKGKIGKDYGTVDLKKFNHPFKPGTTIYECDYDFWEKRWYISEETVAILYFDADGSVSANDGGAEYTVGKDPVFLTQEEAWKYVKKHPKGI